jgi:hypothetical protein
MFLSLGMAGDASDRGARRVVVPCVGVECVGSDSWSGVAHRVGRGADEFLYGDPPRLSGKVFHYI